MSSHMTFEEWLAGYDIGQGVTLRTAWVAAQEEMLIRAAEAIQQNLMRTVSQMPTSQDCQTWNEAISSAAEMVAELPTGW